MVPIKSFSNQFLIASPQLEDPNFNRTLTLICEHSQDGAMGLIVNRTLNLRLGKLFEHMRIDIENNELHDQPVYYGGPIEPERGFVLHRTIGSWENTIALTPTLGLTASRDILSSMAKQGYPQDTLIMLGYAGWGPGQLEEELSGNAWLTLPVEESILFETTPDQRWQKAAQHLGVDINLLSGEIGHA